MLAAALLRRLCIEALKAWAPVGISLPGVARAHPRLLAHLCGALAAPTPSPESDSCTVKACPGAGTRTALIFVLPSALPGGGTPLRLALP